MRTGSTSSGPPVGSPVLFRTLGTSPVPVRGAMVPAPWAHGYHVPLLSPPDRTRPTPPVTAPGRVGPTVVGPDRYETPIPARHPASYGRVPISSRVHDAPRPARNRPGPQAPAHAPRDLDRFLADVETWVRAEYPEVVRGTATRTIDGSVRELAIGLHPAATPVVVSVDADGEVGVRAAFAQVGPGYHTFVGRRPAARGGTGPGLGGGAGRRRAGCADGPGPGGRPAGRGARLPDVARQRADHRPRRAASRCRNRPSRDARRDPLRGRGRSRRASARATTRGWRQPSATRDWRSTSRRGGPTRPTPGIC